MNNHTAANTTGTVNVFTRAINRLLTPLLAIASAIFLTALLLPAPAMAQATNLCTPRGHETFQADSYRYQPGQTVTVTGSGYQPSCNLRMVVIAPDLSATSTVMATDEGGNLSYSFAVNSLAGEWEVETFMGEDTDPWTSTPISNGRVHRDGHAGLRAGQPRDHHRRRLAAGRVGHDRRRSDWLADGGATFTFTPRADLTADVDSAGNLSNGDFVTDLTRLRGCIPCQGHWPIFRFFR